MNIKRWTICLVGNHKWRSVPYAEGTGRFLRCRRCGHEDHGEDATHAHWGTGFIGSTVTKASLQTH